MTQNTHHQRRLGDLTHPRLAALVRWWRTWGLLVQAVWLILLSTVMTTSVVVYAVDQHNAAKTARLSCQRTREFAPALADAYARYQILSSPQLIKYRETIPKRCP